MSTSEYLHPVIYRHWYTIVAAYRIDITNPSFRKSPKAMLSSPLALRSITHTRFLVLLPAPFFLCRSYFLVRRVGWSWSSKGRSLVISRARAHARSTATIGVVNPHLRALSALFRRSISLQQHADPRPESMPILEPFTGSWISGETWTNKRK